MAQNDQMSVGGLQKTIQTAVDAALQNFQPQLNDTVNDFAEKAIDATQGAAKRVVSTARSNPWYFVAGAAAVLVLAGLLASLSGSDQEY